MSTMTEYSWAKDLLTKMGYDVNENNVTSILAWEYAEGGHFHNAAKFNPLNTTLDHAKYGSINSVGVATYPSHDVGLDKTVETLKLDAYAKVRHDLATSASPATTAKSVSASPWGTWHGVAAGPALERARAEVTKHPNLPKGGSDGNSGSDGKGRSGESEKGGKDDAKPASKKIVLDLQELARLQRTYATATDELQRHRRVVGDIAAALEPARAALTDPGLAGVIKATFDWLLEPGGGFDDDARQHDSLAAFTGDIHRLATEADADHDGTWSRGEAMAFAVKHKGADGEALGAVMAALAGGSIVRRSPEDAGSTGGRNGGSSAKGGGSSSGGEGKPSTREQKVDKLLAVAKQQHAGEHNGDNRTKYGAWYGQNGVPWCAQFVSYVYAQSGNPLPAIQSAKGFAYVPYAINYAREHHQLHNTPKRGDIFLLKDGSHTGIVDKVNSDGSFTTVEGNHGDKVDHVTRPDNGSYYFWSAVR